MKHRIYLLIALFLVVSIAFLAMFNIGLGPYYEKNGNCIYLYAGSYCSYNNSEAITVYCSGQQIKYKSAICSVIENKQGCLLLATGWHNDKIQINARKIKADVATRKYVRVLLPDDATCNTIIVVFGDKANEAAVYSIE